MLIQTLHMTLWFPASCIILYGLFFQILSHVSYTCLPVATNLQNSYSIQVAALAPLALLLLLEARCDHLVVAHLN